jgi:hypothetical protein
MQYFLILLAIAKYTVAVYDFIDFNSTESLDESLDDLDIYE